MVLEEYKLYREVTTKSNLILNYSATSTEEEFLGHMAEKPFLWPFHLHAVHPYRQEHTQKTVQAIEIKYI